MFVKGNPGKPKGAVNKDVSDIRKRIKIFLDYETKHVLAVVKKMPDVDRVHFYLEMLQYAVPKMKSIEVTGEVMIKPMTRELPGLTVQEIEQIKELEDKAVARITDITSET